MHSSSMSVPGRRKSSEASIDALLCPKSIHMPNNCQDATKPTNGLNIIDSTDGSEQEEQRDKLPKLRPKIQWRNSWRSATSENEKGRDALRGRKKSGMVFGNAFRRNTAYDALEQPTSEDDMFSEDGMNFSDTPNSPSDKNHARTHSGDGSVIEWFQSENDYSKKRTEEQDKNPKRSSSFHWLHSKTGGSPNPDDADSEDCEDNDEERRDSTERSHSRGSSIFRRLSRTWQRMSGQKSRSDSVPTISSDVPDSERKGSTNTDEDAIEWESSSPRIDASEPESPKKFGFGSLLRRVSGGKPQPANGRRRTETSRLIDD
jgi:hypothetical protein